MSIKLCELYRYSFVGEMHAAPTGPLSSVCLPRQDGVAYHAQESWVLSETIRVIHDLRL